jgi:enoyl-CoA hydratase/carnithine racemase
VSERVEVIIDGRVAVVTLNRPEKHNAIDPQMFDEIADAADRIRSEQAVRAAVICGAGPSFCSGIDLAALIAGDSSLGSVNDELEQPVPNRFQRASCEWIELPVPVIAAIHGNCLGAGLQIALGADIRIAAPDARLAVMEVKWGLIPDMGITRTLPRLVGIDVARELTYTARVFTGEEAARLGIVTRLAEDPHAAANNLALEIAARSPDAIRAAKRLWRDAWSDTPEGALAREAELQRKLIFSPNQLAAVAAGRSGEPAQFIDPA